MILCFSGTGNSRFVAEQLALLLDDRVCMMTTGAACYLASSDPIVVWIFPVHAWSVPPVVANYIYACRPDAFSPRARHYMVATCGDDIGRTDLVWRALMRSRGWRDVGAYSVRMPNTYVLLPGFDVDSSVVEKRKLLESRCRITSIAAGIRRGDSVTDVVPGAMPDVKTKILGPLFRRFLMSPKPFWVNTERCTGCGLCARHCPMHNIIMSTGRPVWGSCCSMCLACYHGCPCDAVEYGRATRSKGRYRGPFKD